MPRTWWSAIIVRTILHSQLAGGLGVEDGVGGGRGRIETTNMGREKLFFEHVIINTESRKVEVGLPNRLI